MGTWKVAMSGRNEDQNRDGAMLYEELKEKGVERRSTRP